MGLTLGHDGTIIDGVSRIGFMTGGHAARWVDEDKADVFTKRCVDFIAAHQASIPFHRMISNHYTLDQVNLAMERMKSYQEVKPVIQF